MAMRIKDPRLKRRVDRAEAAWGSLALERERIRQRSAKAWDKTRREMDPETRALVDLACTQARDDCAAAQCLPINQICVGAGDDFSFYLGSFDEPD